MLFLCVVLLFVYNDGFRNNAFETFSKEVHYRKVKLLIEFRCDYRKAVTLKGAKISWPYWHLIRMRVP